MASLEFVGKYIGADEIESVEVSEKKTPQGDSVIDVTFKGGASRSYPEKTMPYIITDEQSDATKVQERRLMPIVRECMQVIMEHDMDYGDIESFTKQLYSNLDLQYARAESFMWHKNDKKFAPGLDPRYGVSLLDVHSVLEGIQDKDDKRE